MSNSLPLAQAAYKYDIPEDIGNQLVLDIVDKDLKDYVKGETFKLRATITAKVPVPQDLEIKSDIVLAYLLTHYNESAITRYIELIVFCRLQEGFTNDQLQPGLQNKFYPAVQTSRSIRRSALPPRPFLPILHLHSARTIPQ